MINTIKPLCKTLLVTLGIGSVLQAAEPSTWIVPMGGNAFVTASAAGNRDDIERGVTRWTDAATEFSVYFHVDRACDLELGAKWEKVEGATRIRLEGDGLMEAAIITLEANTPTCE